jgi:hypothetical protein
VVINKLADVKDITVESLERDKYAGRFIGQLWLGNYTLTQWLLYNQLVKAYDGGKKQPWTQDELEAIADRCLVFLSQVVQT